MPLLWVYRINDPSEEYTPELDDIRSRLEFKVSRNTTIEELKRSVAENWVVPAERHSYYGVVDRYNDGSQTKFLFDGDEILRGDHDAPVWATLQNIMEHWNEIAVVFLPAEGGDEGDEAERVGLRPVRQVTAPEAFEEGATSAFNIDIDSGWSEDAEETRRSIINAMEALQAKAEAGVREAENPATAPRAEPKTGAGLAPEGDADTGVSGADNRPPETGGVRESGSGRGEDGVCLPDGGNGVVGNSVAAAFDGGAAAAAVMPMAAEPKVSPLRLWLRDLDANGSNTGRFERYAAKFEYEFDSLADLALVPEADGAKGVVWDRVFLRCGVEPTGDQLRIKRAVRELGGGRD